MYTSEALVMVQSNTKNHTEKFKIKRLLVMKSPWEENENRTTVKILSLVVRITVTSSIISKLM